MKKIILCLLFFAITTPCFADVLLPPEEQERVNADRAKRKAEYERRRANCPPEKPLYFDRECYSCDDPKEFIMYYDSVEECSTICPNRKSIQTIPGMAGKSPVACLLEERYIQFKEELERKEQAEQRELYIQTKLEDERNKAAEECGCPPSYPLYGRKKDKNGRFIERCYPCNTPEKLPRTLGTKTCPRGMRTVEIEGAASFTVLGKDVTPNRRTRPCQKSKVTDSSKSRRQKRNDAN